MGNIINLDDNNFTQEVLESQVPVVVDFWATWCGPCRKLTPVLEEVSDLHSDKFKFAKLNVEEHVEIAKNYSIIGLPTVLIFKDGQPVERMTGMLSKSTIISNIEKYL